MGLESTLKYKRESYEQTIARLLVAKTEEERFCALGRAAKGSLLVGKNEEAREYADELQKLTPKYLNNWNYGNAIQDANVVLGSLAVIEGKIEEAKKYLLEAGKSPGSPQMNSFGPNMSLARDLLEKGEKDTVLQYMELCGKFWKNGSDKLKQWAQEIGNNQIPDFKANLFY